MPSTSFHKSRATHVVECHGVWAQAGRDLHWIFDTRGGDSGADVCAGLEPPLGRNHLDTTSSTRSSSRVSGQGLSRVRLGPKIEIAPHPDGMFSRTS